MLDLSSTEAIRASIGNSLENAETCPDTLASLQRAVESQEVTLNAINRANITDADRAATAVLLLNQIGSEASFIRASGPRNLSEFFAASCQFTVPKLRENPFTGGECHIAIRQNVISICSRTPTEQRTVGFNIEDKKVSNWSTHEGWSTEAINHVCQLLETYIRELPAENGSSDSNAWEQMFGSANSVSPKEATSILLEALRKGLKILNASEVKAVKALEDAVQNPTPLQLKQEQTVIDAAGASLAQSNAESPKDAPILGSEDYSAMLKSFPDNDIKKISDCIACLDSLDNSEITNTLAHRAGMTTQTFHVLSLFRAISTLRNTSHIKKIFSETASPKEAALKIKTVDQLMFELSKLERAARHPSSDGEDITRATVTHESHALNRDEPTHIVAFNTDTNYCIIGTGDTYQYEIDTSVLEDYSTASLIELLHVLHKYVTHKPTGVMAVIQKSDMEHGMELLKRVTSIVNERIAERMEKEEEICEALGPLQGI